MILQIISLFKNDIMNTLTFQILIIIGPFYFLLGLIFYSYPIQKRNLVFGYRSPRSNLDDKSWKYAQQISSKYMMISGLILISIALLSFTFNSSKLIDALIGIFSVILSSIFVVLLTEIKLKELQKHDINKE